MFLKIGSLDDTLCMDLGFFIAPSIDNTAVKKRKLLQARQR